jgi:Family of unknown function (DUF695)
MGIDHYKKTERKPTTMSSTVKQSSGDWFAAEANNLGQPILIRGRRSHCLQVPNRRFPFIFVVTHRYDVKDTTALPDLGQYSAIERFESDALDGIESANLGLLVFVETSNGTVRYYLYVQNVDDTADFLVTHSSGTFLVELASDLDSDWGEYRKLMARVEGAD